MDLFWQPLAAQKAWYFRKFLREFLALGNLFRA
jgi:hypothetical protein